MSQMCFIEVTLTLKNPLPLIYSLHVYILENYKYAHNGETT